MFPTSPRSYVLVVTDPILTVYAQSAVNWLRYLYTETIVVLQGR